MSAFRDLAATNLVQTSVWPDERTASFNGLTLDMLSTDGECFAIQQVGDFSGDGLIGTIEESVDGSAWTAITGAEFTQVGDTQDIQTIRFTRTKRYLRYVGTLDGDTPTAVVSVAIGARKKYV